VKYLVDTNVLSEARRAKGHPAVRAKLRSIDDGDLFLSVVTIGEIARGIARLPTGTQRDELTAWLRFTRQHYTDRILPISADIALEWGEVTAVLEKAGRVLPAADGLIAATALHHRLCVLTRNEDDFRGTGVTVVNPLHE
jgi:predicted nucleic acid-binding protein